MLRYQKCQVTLWMNYQSHDHHRRLWRGYRGKHICDSRGCTHLKMFGITHAPTLLCAASCSYIQQLWGKFWGGYLVQCCTVEISFLHCCTPVIFPNSASSCIYASQKWMFVADVVAESRSYDGRVFPVACWEANRELNVSVDNRQCFRKLQITSVVVYGQGRSTTFRMPIYPMLNQWNANPMTPNPGL